MCKPRTCSIWGGGHSANTELSESSGASKVHQLCKAGTAIRKGVHETHPFCRPTGLYSSLLREQFRGIMLTWYMWGLSFTPVLPKGLKTNAKTKINIFKLLTHREFVLRERMPKQMPPHPANKSLPDMQPDAHSAEPGQGTRQ